MGIDLLLPFTYPGTFWSFPLVFWPYTTYSCCCNYTELWPHTLWDPLYTPAVVDNTLYATPATSEEVHAAPISVWGSLMNSVWSSSPWSVGTGSVVPPISTAPGPIVPPAPIPTPRQEVAHNINEDVAADVDVSDVCLKCVRGYFSPR
jgi:hypothetical protein